MHSLEAGHPHARFLLALLRLDAIVARQLLVPGARPPAIAVVRLVVEDNDLPQASRVPEAA